MNAVAIVGQDAHKLHHHLRPQPIRIKGIDMQCVRLQLKSQPDPTALQGEDVLLRVRAFSCNYRDQGLMLQMYQRDPARCLWPVGSEFVADILAVGPQVTQLHVGNRVMGNNAFVGSHFAGDVPFNGGVVTNHAGVEYQVLPASKLQQVPVWMDDATAAGFSLGAQTAYGMVRRAKVHEGHRVLVMSATSNTSQFLLAALKARGIAAWACSSSAVHCTDEESSGIHHVRGGPEAANNLLKTAVEVGGFDAVLDPFLDLNARVAMPTLKPGGRYVSCGMLKQVLHEHDYQAPHMTNLQEVIGLGIQNNLELHLNCLGHPEDLQLAIQDHQEESWEVKIDRIYRPGQEAAFLHRTFEDRKRNGKVIYQMQEIAE